MLIYFLCFFVLLKHFLKKVFLFLLAAHQLFSNIRLCLQVCALTHIFNYLIDSYLGIYIFFRIFNFIYFLIFFTNLIYTCIYLGYLLVFFLLRLRLLTWICYAYLIRILSLWIIWLALRFWIITRFNVLIDLKIIIIWYIKFSLSSSF